MRVYATAVMNAYKPVPRRHRQKVEAVQAAAIVEEAGGITVVVDKCSPEAAAGQHLQACGSGGGEARFEQLVLFNALDKLQHHLGSAQLVNEIGICSQVGAGGWQGGLLVLFTPC